jgi:hypothetical protein
MTSSQASLIAAQLWVLIVMAVTVAVVVTVCGSFYVSELARVRARDKLIMEGKLVITTEPRPRKEPGS